MKSLGWIAVVAASLFATSGVQAQLSTPASSSSNITVQCKDGTSQTVTSTRGACRGHKGIDKSGGSAGAASASGNSGHSGAASTSTGSSSASSSHTASTSTPAAGGGPGQVWVNTGSKTKAYHCQGSKWYGTTKSGKYMSVSDAQAAGYHAAKNEKCS